MPTRPPGLHRLPARPRRGGAAGLQQLLRFWWIPALGDRAGWSGTSRRPSGATMARSRPPATCHRHRPPGAGDCFIGESDEEARSATSTACRATSRTNTRCSRSPDYERRRLSRPRRSSRPPSPICVPALRDLRRHPVSRARPVGIDDHPDRGSAGTPGITSSSAHLYEPEDRVPGVPIVTGLLRRWSC